MFRLGKLASKGKVYLLVRLLLGIVSSKVLFFVLTGVKNKLIISSLKKLFYHLLGHLGSFF
ncbi:hypothetical protein DIX83_01050 [Streptococcus iniae]|uniref:Uncharacterized protein n=1 Tax=Streptococcus iniae TaxID=1346 RepID=A0A3L8GQX7_STRIN|nr:hypothetical protein K710_0222 [Streptococcus iniae SF1]AYB02093.1 hypothetical protein D5R92_06760 [Streptococcus iniae]EKB52377.1 hypothetical protein A0G_0212 [Streptococcus iniae 9117]AYB03960.1 hypothetical protein D5R90_06795 [Streptococcus iniae]RLU29316.1 hypothetical protein DIY15_01075 [Streptococcus iniae]